VIAQLEKDRVEREDVRSVQELRSVCTADAFDGGAKRGAQVFGEDPLEHQKAPLFEVASLLLVEVHG